MPASTHNFDDLEFLVKTTSPEDLAQKFGVPVEDIVGAKNIGGLRAILMAAAATAAVAEAQRIDEHEGYDAGVAVKSVATPLEFQTIRQEWGYLVTPRHKYVFIKPCPQDHPARSIFPKSEPTDQEIGFIHASLVDDLKEGDLVSYDKFSAIGGGMDLVDMYGDPIYCVMIDDRAITGKLERKDCRKV